MAQINGSSSKNNFGFYAIVNETIPSDYVTSNKTIINYEVYIKNNGSRFNSNNWIKSASVDNENVYYESGVNINSTSVGYQDAMLLFSGSKEIEHNTDGTKTITFSASISKSTSYSSYDPGYCSLSGTILLTTIPRNKPVITSSSFKDTNATTKALTGNDNIIVKGASTGVVTVVFQSFDDSTATIKIGGVTVTPTSNKSGTTTTYTATRTFEKCTISGVGIEITDSRGLTTTGSVNASNILDYIPVTISASVNRTDGVSGNATLSFNGNFWNGNFGATTNSLTIQYQYKKKSDSSYTTASVTPTINGNKYSGSKSLTGLDVKSEYDLRIIAKDKVNTSGFILNLTIPKGTPALWFNNDTFKMFGQKMQVPYILYSNDNGSTGTITLSDSAANYDYIEIYYKSRYGQLKSTKIYSPNNKEILLDWFHIFASSSQTGVAISALKTINNTTITTRSNGDDYGEWWTNNNRIVNENYIYITKVIGYK